MRELFVINFPFELRKLSVFWLNESSINEF